MAPLAGLEKRAQVAARAVELVEVDAAFFGVGVLAVEDGDVADEGDEAAFGFCGELGGEGFLLVFVFVEFDFDEFAVGEGFADGLEEGVAEAGATDFEGGVHALGEGF